jgi:hypothetical protein
MDAASLIEKLAAGAGIVRAVTEGLAPEESRWKPPSQGWSIVEVVCHLADEEVEDFRTRLAHVLDQRPGAWPPIDPQGWARTRKYNDRSLGDCLPRFLDERRTSLAWLRSLKQPNWNLAYEHPRFGPIRAGDLLASWAAHDLLHARQIVKRRYEMVSVLGEPFSTRYAGEWGA